jgi:Zn-dependent M28 family amino/carboxypeptidase
VETVNARNVIGIVPGSDESLQYQYISVTAHYDHDGIKNGIIYNGADDNASGTTAVLESARQISSLRKNKRPVIFIFFSAEEKGLLGSDYYVNNTDYISDVIANINVDMVGRESSDTIFVVGSGRISGEYYRLVEEANKETVHFHFDYSYDQEGHPERIYYRSDHWKFAQKGIPAVFFTDMHKADYHKPTDDAERINYEKVEKVTRLTTQIILKTANLKHKLTINNSNFSSNQEI